MRVEEIPDAGDKPDDREARDNGALHEGFQHPRVAVAVVTEPEARGERHDGADRDRRKEQEDACPKAQTCDHGLLHRRANS